jgi:tetratricopeptide (TPR) repeat protein
MRALLAVPMLLLAGPAPPSDRLSSLLAEVRESSHIEFGCFAKSHVPPLSGDVGTIVAAYQRSRGLATPASARAVLASLIEYTLRPSAGTYQPLRRALEQSGSEAAAEDVCRCVYFEGGDTRVGLMESVAPASTGLFWAARVLHEANRTEEALAYYRRALQASPTNSRTRLLYAIALIHEQRPGEAAKILADLEPGWAPEPVAYWRARALMDAGDPAAARPLLEPLRGRWSDGPTVPEAWVDSAPVQAPSPPVCLLGIVRLEEGDEAAARGLLQDRECKRELGRLELRQGRPFEALLSLEDSARDDPRFLEALSRLGACEWTRVDLAGWEEGCRGTHPWNGCPLFRTLAPEVAKACPTLLEEAGGDDSALEARLEAPRLAPYEERPLPARWRFTGQRPDGPRLAKAFGGLSAFSLVAVSPVGRRLFAVSVSHDVDPRGEVSAGGYWLHLSADRGGTWEGPYYLGIAEQYPYVVLPAARVPAWDGERVNLEVERREVDETTITFPPVGLRARSVEKDLYLSVDLAAVRRDADGDGLTDLLEEKLALDPQSPDTDGDGRPDGSDPLPLQARSDAEASERASLLEVALPHLFGGPPPVQQTAAEGEEGSAMSWQARPFASARTLFVSGPDVALPHGAGVRAIGLPPAALAAYRRKFGATYPMALPDIAFDQDRRRALIRYNFGWRGGSLLAERKDGRWVITPRVSWIT